MQQMMGGVKNVVRVSEHMMGGDLQSAQTPNHCPFIRNLRAAELKGSKRGLSLQRMVNWHTTGN
jgi:hypothetical protein